MAARWLAMLALGACAPGGVAGTWSGSCDLKGGVPEYYAIDAFVLNASGGTISGVATIHPDWLAEPLDGTVTGTVDGGEVVLVADMGDAVMGFELSLTGTLQGDTIEGDCRTEQASGSGRLDRVDTAGSDG